MKVRALPYLDGELRTLHVRCGSDLKAPLQDAGFRGDFYEHNYPYLIGPVCEGPGSLDQRARFLVDNYADSREEMALQLLAEHEINLSRLFGRLTYERDPLPGQGEFQIRDRVLNMEGASARVYERHPGVGRNGEARPPWTEVLTITDLGRAVLKGEVDFLSLGPPNRWVGGVQIGAGLPDWRWNEQIKDAVCLREPLASDL